MDIHTPIQEYIASLNDEVMAILDDDRLDKRAKNLKIKPLVAKKKILLNTIDALNLVERENEEN